MKWILILYLILPESGKSVFVVNQASFYSQSECQIARLDMELYLREFPEYAITCASVPEERES